MTHPSLTIYVLAGRCDRQDLSTDGNLCTVEGIPFFSNLFLMVVFSVHLLIFAKNIFVRCCSYWKALAAGSSHKGEEQIFIYILHENQQDVNKLLVVGWEWKKARATINLKSIFSKTMFSRM